MGLPEGSPYLKRPPDAREEPCAGRAAHSLLCAAHILWCGYSTFFTWRYSFGKSFPFCFVGRLPAIVLSVLGGHALSNAQYHIAVIAFVVILITASIGAYFFQKHRKNTKEDPQK